MKSLMDDAAIRMDRAEARKQFLAYRHAVRERHNIEDAQIMRGYRALSQGRQVINLRLVIAAGGISPDGMPRLAVAQSDSRWVWCDRQANGAVTFLPRDAWAMRSNMRKGVFEFGADTLPGCRELGHDMTKYVYSREHSDGGHAKWGGAFRAMVPVVPPALRPVHALSNYATLFEVADWSKAPRPPGDPALLKYVGGELYAVLAAWDLTPLEQAVLAGRHLRPSN